MYFYSGKISEILPSQCEKCGVEEDDLGVCPYEECGNQQLLCSDCLFEHMVTHHEEE